MDIIECLKKRRSIRQYQDKPIPKKVIEDIVACANSAPSARGLYSWKFVVVTDREKLRKMGEAAPNGSFISSASACIVVCGKVDNPFTPFDCSAATQNVMLAAMAHGLGSCWVNGWKKDYNPQIAKIINLADDYETVSLIPIGYPAGEPRPRAQKELKEVLCWEEF